MLQSQLEGRYLVLTRDLPSEDDGWTSEPFDLPESWKIESITVVGERTRIVLADKRVFEIDPVNHFFLKHDLASNGPMKSDKELERAWVEHAARK